MKIGIPRGTADILPGEVERWQYIEGLAREWAGRYNYREVRTPVFEHTELFLRGVGETTDIVEKEMYTFLDRKGRSFTLRPEGTASVVRTYVEHKLYAEPGVTKWYYMGPMFRYERPQSGRSRQFTQFGVEALGSGHPSVDGEVIALAHNFLRDLGLRHLRLELNSVGCADCRPLHREKLIQHMRSTRAQLCEDCQSRLERNPMRILDCKNERCRQLTNEAPTLLDCLCPDCSAHFEQVQEQLHRIDISFEVNPRLVRGLDYYTQTAFEFMLDGVQAMGTLCGGGRYNGLVKELGGEDVPGIGFALSFERLLPALEAQQVALPVKTALDLYLAPLGEAAQREMLPILEELRKAGFRVEADFQGRKMKAQLKAADRLGARWVLILGEQELARGEIQLKEMASGLQQAVALPSLLPFLQEQKSVSSVQGEVEA